MLPWSRRLEESLRRREVGSADVLETLVAIVEELPMGSEARPSVDYIGRRLRLEFALASEVNAFAGAVEEAASFFMMTVGGGVLRVYRVFGNGWK